jgi:hypothetical protein
MITGAPVKDTLLSALLPGFLLRILELDFELNLWNCHLSSRSKFCWPVEGVINSRHICILLFVLLILILSLAVSQSSVGADYNLFVISFIFVH